jgi:hypothetical protein
MSSLTCENCGSVSFSQHEDGYYVCDDCQVQSQEYIAEEQEFEDAGGGNSTHRRGGMRKVATLLDPENPRKRAKMQLEDSTPATFNETCHAFQLILAMQLRDIANEFGALGADESVRNAVGALWRRYLRTSIRRRGKHFPRVIDTLALSYLGCAVRCAAVSAADIVRAALHGTVAYMHAYRELAHTMFDGSPIPPSLRAPTSALRPKVLPTTLVVRSRAQRIIARLGLAVPPLAPRFAQRIGADLGLTPALAAAQLDLATATHKLALLCKHAEQPARVFPSANAMDPTLGRSGALMSAAIVCLKLSFSLDVVPPNPTAVDVARLSPFVHCAALASEGTVAISGSLRTCRLSTREAHGLASRVRTDAKWQHCGEGGIAHSMADEAPLFQTVHSDHAALHIALNEHTSAPPLPSDTYAVYNQLDGDLAKPTLPIPYTLLLLRGAHYVDVEPRVLHHAVLALERCLPKLEVALQKRPSVLVDDQEA